jgi:hypothetical protein
MDKLTEKTLAALLSEAGLEPKEGDLERFDQLIDRYRAALRALHSIDLGEEEIGPTFHPEWQTK